MYYLDTNTCIYYLNGRSDRIKAKLLSTPPVQIAIPAMVKAELLLGSYEGQTPAKTLDKVEKFLQPFEVIPFSDQITYEYAHIRSTIEQQGSTIGPNDIIIAAITRFHEAILVTHNVKEFSRIEGLHIEDWK